MVIGEFFSDKKGNLWAFELSQRIFFQLENRCKLIPKYKIKSSVPIRMIQTENITYGTTISSYHIFQCDASQDQLRNVGLEEAAEHYWSNSYLYENSIWFVPQELGGDLEQFDLIKGEFRKDDNFTRQLKSYVVDERLLTVFSCSWEHYIIGAIYGTAHIYQYNTKTQTMELHNLANHQKLCSAIFDGRYYWMTQLESNTILQWEKGTGTLREFFVDGEICERPYGRMFIAGQHLIVLPSWGKNLIAINLKTIELVQFRLSDEYIENTADNSSSFLFSGTILGTQLLLPPWRGNDILLTLDLENMTLSETKLSWGNPGFFIQECLAAAGTVLYEGATEWNTLEAYCHAIVQTKRRTHMEDVDICGKVGKRIYDRLQK